jgi:hypothetical protein
MSTFPFRERDKFKRGRNARRHYRGLTVAEIASLRLDLFARAAP